MTTMTSASQDPAGWINRCARCGRNYWAAWQPSSGRVRRFDVLNRTEPHQCTPQEENPAP